MKNKLYIISAIIVCLSIALSACDNNKKEPETTAPESVTASQTETVDTQTQTVTYIDSSGYHVVSRIEPSTQERTHPPVPSRTQSDSYNIETIPYNPDLSKAPLTLPKVERPTSSSGINNPTHTTANTGEAETVPEKANGLSVQFKSNPVRRGNDATIAINGEAGKQYVIEVYRNDKDILTSDKLSQQTANSLGIVSWTFETDNLNHGYRKIIVKELNSSKYVQTSILIN